MTLMEKEINEQSHILDTVHEANTPTIQKLVAKMKEKKCRYAYFAARGTSDHASIYAQYLFGTYAGLPSGLACCSILTAYEGNLDLSDAVVFGVSQSGKAADALAVMEHAKKQGAVVVSVTNYADSPMAKVADFSLLCNAGEEKSVAATKTFTAQMYVMALVVAEYTQNSTLQNALQQVPEALGHWLPALNQSIDSFVSRYRYSNDGFSLGRGVNYPVALEAALKLQETNYVRMKGAAVSDFYHGPLAQVEPGTFVILFASHGPVYKDAVAMLSKLDELGAETLVVTDDKDLAASRQLSVRTPDVGTDAASVYFNAVFAQTFACKLTAVKGRNPDEPRNLKKVTITK
ncbi:MAG TPA: glutamine--fructose-6-phosphate aminotransferase [Clostridiales bacterium]|jgi:glucosamine--fructose-6-phosphate aminotransferase (isomerizing)|nr:glutamine--fructose-6-phosphate aminotransferase [Clostridiales bacterium]